MSGGGRERRERGAVQAEGVSKGTVRCGHDTPSERQGCCRWTVVERAGECRGAGGGSNKEELGQGQRWMGTQRVATAGAEDRRQSCGGGRLPYVTVSKRADTFLFTVSKRATPAHDDPALPRWGDRQR